MKICPFISHMIGEEQANVLEVEHGQAGDPGPEATTPKGAEAIMLGYDEGDGGVAVETKPKTRAKTRAKAKSRAKAASKAKESPLFCLKDTCRFYQKKGSTCMFDSMHTMMADNAKAAKTTNEPVDVDTSGIEKSVEKTGAKVTREMDKFWKFQTKSVAELIASIGEVEKNHEQSMTRLGKGLEKKLEGFQGSTRIDGLDDLKAGLSKIDDLSAGIKSLDDLKAGVKKINGMEAGIKQIGELKAGIQKIDDVAAGIKQIGDLKAGIQKIDDVRADIKKLDGLQADMRKLDEIRRDMKQFTNLREEMKQLSGFREDMKQLGDLRGEMKQLEKLRSGITGLTETVEAREESTENFTTTISEIIVNIEDGLRSLRTDNDGIASRMESLEKSVGDVSGIEKSVESAIGKHFGESAAAPDLSDDVRNISREIQDFVESTKRFERGVEDWQSRLESSVGEMRESQRSWDARIDEISRKQSEIASLVESNGRQQGDSSPNRKEARKLNNLGVNSFHNNDLDMARDQFQRAVQVDDRFAEAYNNLGLVYTELEEEQAASEAFERAIALNPDLPAAYSNLGYVFYRQGRFEEAVEKYTEAISRSSSSSSAHTNLGNAYYKMGKYDDARQAWEKALDLDPDNEKASRNLDRLD